MEASVCQSEGPAEDGELQAQAQLQAPLGLRVHAPSTSTNATPCDSSRHTLSPSEASSSSSSVLSVAAQRSSVSALSRPSTTATPSPHPLALSSAATTPAAGSTTEALEARCGINTQKLAPSDFLFGRELGEGAFAKVVLATRRSDEATFACKVVDKHFITKMGKVQTVMNEKRILTLLHGHVGIVKLAYTFQDAKSLYYVMELARGGEMFADIKRVGKYDLALTRFYTAELVEILYHMHSKSIVHRDLKPENVLFSESLHLKLTDFGTAKELAGPDAAAGKRRGSFVGTAEYVCPEVLKDKVPTTAADMWALGAMVFQMATGKVPFRGNSEYLTFQKILNLQIRWPDDIDPQAKDLIQKLLVLDPAHRLGSTLAGYTELRAHPFFADIDFATIFEQPVPPRPQPTVIVPDEPDVYEYNEVDEEDDDQDEPNGGGDGGGESDEEFRLKMEQLAAEDEARKVAEEEEDEAARQAQSESFSPSPTPSTSPSLPTTPHGPTLAEKTAAAAAHQHSPSMSTNSSSSQWGRFLRGGEAIVFTGLVMKRRALFARKRQLILTDAPRLFYVDPVAMAMRKEVPWSERLWAEVVDDVTFYIHVPGRDYYMRGLSSSAYCWVNEINNLQLAVKAKSSAATW